MMCMARNTIGKVASIVSGASAFVFGLSMNLGTNLVGVIPSRVVVVAISLAILVTAIFSLIADFQNF